MLIWCHPISLLQCAEIFYWLTTPHLGVHDQCLESAKQSRATILWFVLHVPSKWSVWSTSKTTNLQLTLLPEDPLGDLAPAVWKKSVSVKTVQQIMNVYTNLGQIVPNRLFPTNLKTTIFSLVLKETFFLMLCTRIWCLIMQRGKLAGYLRVWTRIWTWGYSETNVSRGQSGTQTLEY